MPIFEISDVLTPPQPSLLCPFILLERVHTGQQPIVEQRIWFPEVDDIEFNRLIFGDIGHPEVEPLRVALGIEVILQQQVILALTYLHRFIATL